MDKINEYNFVKKIGKGKIRTKEGLFCECGEKLKNISERCECNS